MRYENMLDMIFDLILFTLKSNAPKKTGNLALNAIRRTEDGISIGGELAPYAYKTEEINRSSKGWIARTMESLMPIISQIAKKELTIDEVLKMTDDRKASTDLQFQHLARAKEIELEGL